MSSKEDVESFLGSRLNLQLATIDETDYPNIQPVWFYHDNDKNRLYILTSNTAKKTLNIRNNSKVYFSVDESNIPYKGVKGKGTATIFKDQTTIISAAEKISKKYYGSLDNPASKSMIDRSKEQDAVVIEINPKFFSTWIWIWIVIVPKRYAKLLVGNAKCMYCLDLQSTLCIWQTT